MAFMSVDLFGNIRDKNDKVWFIYWKTQIEQLMPGSKETYVAALKPSAPLIY